MEQDDKSCYTNRIQEYLCSKICSDAKVSEKCIIATETYCIVNWKRYFRLVALIRKRTSHAVAIFKAKKNLDQTINNVILVDILPLNLGFNFETDSNRSSNGEFHPAVLSGEDFILIDMDPLNLASDKSGADMKESRQKIFQLDFFKEDFQRFCENLRNASQFIAERELYSNFDWLRKLKDDAASDICLTTEFNDHESDDEPSPQPNEYNLNELLLSQESTEERLYTDGLSPAKCNMFISLVNQDAAFKVQINAANRISNQSMVDFDEVPFQSMPAKVSFDHCKSAPDLINSQLDDITTSSSINYNPKSNNPQYLYIENKLRQKENDYCSWEDHNLFVGTWNVNGRIDDSLSLDDWLTPPPNVKYPSIYILGFQEIDLSIGSVALNKSNISILEERWLKLIEKSYPFEKHSYKRLHRFRLAGILLIVYVDHKLAKSIPNSGVLSNKLPTGIFNVMGNKGAVGIRFQALNSKLCFINCHLAAGESNRLRRDQDFRDIEKNLIFYDKAGKTISIYEHDVVFLMGDLNYRISNLEVSVVKDLVINNNIEKLLENDELLTFSRSVFKRFYEGKIKFSPTYKFDTNTDEYDTSEKNRVPSFCDRIMWVGEHCCLKNYSSIMSLKISDHKPVSGFFNIGLKKVNPVKRLKVQEAIIRSMDLIYNSSLPQAKIDKQEINFKDVHFYEHKQASIVVTNIGHYEFMFNFKDLPGCPKVPDWLTVQPSEGTVKTGETCELVFEIFINAKNVSELNTKAEIQCILVLKLQGGKDYFITVTSDFVPTSFGLPLTLLVSLKKPIATFNRKELYEKSKPYIQRVSIANHGSNAFTTPKEVFVMIDYLLKNIDEEELFARPGSHSEIQCIREQLDIYGIKADFSDICVHSVTEALLMFINSLYFPIIPKELKRECISSHNNFIDALQVIVKLPMDHKNLFHYLTSFLRKVLQHRSSNGTDSVSLSVLFVDLIFQPKNLNFSEREMCSNFIQQFLINDPAKYFGKGQNK